MQLMPGAGRLLAHPRVPRKGSSSRRERAGEGVGVPHLTSPDSSFCKSQPGRQGLTSSNMHVRVGYC